MDKIITINLGGYAIKMEEDAYEALKPYIRQIELTFANSENGKEIINDIEARIAEMLMERTEAKVGATMEDVEFVKKAMGNPGEFDDSQPEDAPKQSAVPNDTVRKRLYRDTDNKVFGGVCSGIANYFNIDPVIVRLIWVFLLFVMGVGFLLYFIMWVIVPEAVTTAQKLEMKGEAPTLDNIINRVKAEAGKVEQNLRSKDLGQKISSFFHSLSPIIIAILKGIAIIAGLIVLIVISGIFIALTTGSGSLIFNDHGVFLHGIPNIFDAKWEFLTFRVLVGMFICIPLFALLTGLLKFAFNSNVNYKPTRRVLGWVWVATIPLLIFFIYTGVKNFRSSETVSSEKTESIRQPILIKAAFNEDSYFFERIDIRITPSEDSLLHIYTSQSANGKNPAEALVLAEKNGASYSFSNNELTLKTSDHFEKSGMYRKQKVEFIIRIPNGRSFSLDKSVQKTGVSVEGQNITWYGNHINEKSNALLFLNSGLYCPACPDSIPVGSSGLHTYTNFDRIDAEGIVDIEIRPGSTYSIQKSGPEQVIRHLEIWQSGSVLEISMDDDYINLKTRPKVIITMPQLASLELSGVTTCNVGHFGGELLLIDLSGASKAEIDAEYNEIQVGMSGVSHLEISGNTKTIHWNVSGASVINAEKLTMDKVQVYFSGASEAILGQARSISGEMSGACKIQYTGNPTLHVNSSGVSKIRQVGK